MQFLQTFITKQFVLSTETTRSRLIGVSVKNLLLMNCEYYSHRKQITEPIICQGEMCECSYVKILYKFSELAQLTLLHLLLLLLRCDVVSPKKIQYKPWRKPFKHSRIQIQLILDSERTLVCVSVCLCLFGLHWIYLRCVNNLKYFAYKKRIPAIIHLRCFHCQQNNKHGPHLFLIHLRVYVSSRISRVFYERHISFPWRSHRIYKL